MKAVVSIAGSDSSGGAGIQADIKTIAAHHLFAETVITALTAQNTLGVTGVHEVPAAFVSEQIDAVFSDIRPDAVKVGMVSSAEIIEAIARGLDKWQAENIVVDPVMVATSGAPLIGEDAISELVEKLLPRARVITPNIPEAQVLCGRKLPDEAACERAAAELAQSLGTDVLVKGGHGSHDANDVLATRTGEIHWFRHRAVATENTHGTGCTLSSAIACGLACGLSVPDAVSAAKEYLTGALSAGLDLGQGSGPLDHMWRNA